MSNIDNQKAYFPKEDLKDLLGYCDLSDEGYELIDNQITGTSRWLTHYRMIFSCRGNLWGVDYSKGSTEMQDMQPFEYEGQMVECYAVEAKTKTVTYYEKVS